MVLTTSNITQAIDVAFVDRADIKAYIGPPTLAARYEMLRGSVVELSRAGIIAEDMSQMLLPYAAAVAISPPGASAAAGVGLSANSHLHATLYGSSRAATAGAIEAATAGVAGLGCGEATAGSGDVDSVSALVPTLSAMLLAAAVVCDGLSGRTLRKLPFLAHAGSPRLALAVPCAGKHFLRALHDAAAREQQDRSQLLSG
ncbi:hypothetical protein Vafri_4659 [Volvox africanus]|uniref:Pachytene checkpoint protein 2 C-terminal domain-containing protein n=1 Tax=Volvox africanus TaxID=51714 RepID=A0A8J4EUK7_9CHLO|nr:hypothetical protein Vafri_4659 [Volvox africanus]